jgi:sulfur transfer protein SufE
MAEQPQKLKRLLQLFEAIPDRADRIQMLIDTADRFRPVPASIASRPYPEAHKTPACVSVVYVFTEPLGDGTLRFHFGV